MDCIPRGHVVKEGWLRKKGEFIKNWRARYFQLYSDGYLLGFKGGSPYDGGLAENSFRITNCRIVMDRKTENLFQCSFLDQKCVIYRLFKAESGEDREEWVKCISETSQANLELAEESVSGATRSHQSSKSANLMSSPSSLSTFSSTAEQDLRMEDFQIISVVGRGTFGKVVLATPRNKHLNHKTVAIKLLKKDVIKEKEEVQHTLNESRVLRKIDHPFLTKLIASFQTNDRLCFVMEYVSGGELFYHLSRDRVFEPRRAMLYGAEIVLGLGYLHERGIIYRDLKLENLLLDHEGHVKITDFGLSKENMGYGHTTTTFCGTPEYLAPEILEYDDYTRAVDWWGFGVVMYEMLCGVLPFAAADNNIDKLFNMIVRENVKFPRNLFWIPFATDFLEKLLIKDPARRLGSGPDDVEEIKRHDFFRMLNFDDVYHKRIPVTFIPSVSSVADVSNFEPEFTNEPNTLTPISCKMNENFRDTTFDNFSFIPHAL